MENAASRNSCNTLTSMATSLCRWRCSGGEKAEKKKSEIEGQLKELYDKKTELENLEIINTVRSMVMDKDQIMAFLSSMKGGTKTAENTEVIDNA